MCITLVIPGEVQIDIRFFVSLKAKEGFKWNVKSILLKLCPALRAFLIGHIVAAGSCIRTHFLRIEITVMTLRAIIVRCQRIYLGNTGHGRYEGRTYGTTGTNQISVFIGFPNQLLGDDIHHREPIGNNGIQLSFQTLTNHLRKRVPIHRMCLIVAYISKLLVRIFDDRWTFIRSYRRNLLNHICNQIGVLNDNLICLFRAKISKFLQHFFRGS